MAALAWLKLAHLDFLIEVLGVSLPWRGVFTNEGPGARLPERAKNLQNATNPFSSGSDSNPFSGASSNENVTLPVQPSGSTNNLVDLLSGEVILSEHIADPVIRNEDKGGDLLDFLDQAIVEHHGAETDHKFPSSHDGRPSDSSSQQYIDCLKTYAGPRMERKLDFMEAMKLEIERLRLNISAAERDRALLSIGTDPATINPNVLLDERYMGRLCRVANSLALLGQASLEDKITSAIGLETTDDNVVDFWNTTRFGEYCSGGTCCEVRADTNAPTRASISAGVSPSVLLCSQCEKKVCKVCCAGRGALLVAGYGSREAMNYNGVVNQGGSSRGFQVDASTNRTVVLDSVICKKCCPDIVLDALILDYVRVLISTRRSARADFAAHEALNQVIGFSLSKCLSERKQPSDRQRAIEVEKQLLDGEESLAEFPFASFLNLVETAADSAPLLSLLAPLDCGSQHSYWKAPPSTTCAEFIIVLGTLSDVSGVVLLVSPCGFSEADAPTVQIWASNKIHKEERSCMGKWDLQSQLMSSSEYFGPEKLVGDDEVPRHVHFAFRNPVRCRIIWITLRLQRPGSSSLSLGNLNLLSLDENPFAEVTRRASFGGEVERDPCIHAKRILVVGSPVKREMADTSSQGTDQINLKGWLERDPPLNRFRVPVEAERLLDNDVVLEQYLSPASPLLAGFRLDAFSAIKPLVTHSPSSNAQIWDRSSSLVDERHISPAVLYIQVSVVQEPHSLVTIAEYRLPEAKAGTPMYFDFPGEIQTRRITFKLLGDITAFADDPSEQDDLGSGGLPVASGLSLSNRIKLYYYGDPYELGKWANLSAV